MEFSNSDTGVLGFTGSEPAWYVDFARLAVGTLALDDVFHHFVASVVFAIASEEF